MDKELQELKNQIGFGMAFKATLGFYAAQMLAQTIGLGLFIATIYGLFRIIYG